MPDMQKKAARNKKKNKEQTTAKETLDTFVQAMGEIYHADMRGRGRGRGTGRGRGKVRGKSRFTESNKDDRNKCYNCNEEGHWARDCPNQSGDEGYVKSKK